MTCFRTSSAFARRLEAPIGGRHSLSLSNVQRPTAAGRPFARTRCGPRFALAAGIDAFGKLPRPSASVRAVSPARLLLLLLAIVGAVHVPAWFGAFVWDDRLVVGENAALQNGDLAALLTRNGEAAPQAGEAGA